MQRQRQTLMSFTSQSLRVLMIASHDNQTRHLLAVLRASRTPRFEVVHAANGSEALRLVMEAQPEVVLLDMNMPVLDGEGFIAAVRERGLRIPIVIMTAGSSAKRWASQLGADAYLSKPFELANLVDVTNRFATTMNAADDN